MATATTISPTENRGFVLRIVIKAALLFALLNLVYALIQPLPLLARISLYNRVVSGRERLPFGENPDSYNLSLFQLDAMFASHEVSQPKAADEYRVLVIGDSSVWGILLKPNETLAAEINDLHLTAPDGRKVRAYNLGYPTISVMKDLLLLNHEMAYQPDAIIWLTTLEAMPAHKQVSSPIVQNNADEVRALVREYNLKIDEDEPAFVDASFIDKTLVGQRRSLSDLLRLNMYGFLWASTGIDQLYPENYDLRANDLEASTDFYGLTDPLSQSDLAFDVIDAGIKRAGDVPVILVNEPMFIADGENSDIRYNFYYPRWAYDQYRDLMQRNADSHGWNYLDLWDIAQGSEFTNSAIHLTPEGEELLAERIAAALQGVAK
jgi:hypothetical protein